jgi:D-tagatose-1,6-bisphosphate aldolase subunit GatZ/KbaZ
MYLDKIVRRQKRAEALGIPSVCSAHPYVIQQTLEVSQTFGVPALIEATCNQVNQFGGYTGMTPADFVGYVRRIAQANNFPFENIILGGDHLGPSVWQDEPEDVAMGKAEQLIQHFVEAGFVKIHLDCSMRLANDPEGGLDVELSARRTARLARAAERVGNRDLRYVIGTEVPIPGGAKEHEQDVQVTRVEDARQTIQVTREAFYRAGLPAAWERVIAIVVQPGVEFGDNFVLPYQPTAAQQLSEFIESQPMIFEAHSTDYQTCQALKNLVSDHFAILKVGPALTFAFREGVFALASMENEMFPSQERSNIISVLDQVMMERPEDWIKYYHGSAQEQAFKRKYSFSDRIRYYWTHPAVKEAFGNMLRTLNQKPLPDALLKQYVPELTLMLLKTGALTPEKILYLKIQNVLDDYAQAVKP